MNVLDLFSGIGGFSLGLERAGMRTVAFCEIDPFCRAVLRKHWPGVPIFEDVRTLTAADVSGVDVICGGFPCQDISSLNANKRGLDGPRSGLWSEYARLVGELRPSYVIVENVATLLARGLGGVLADLAALGYDSEWHCISAAVIGAPIQAEGRDRVWIVAEPHGGRQCGPWLSRRLERELLACAAWGCSDFAGLSSTASDHWKVEPGVDRVVDGIPNRVDRIHALGNAVVPQIPEIIGRAIMRVA